MSTMINGNAILEPKAVQPVGVARTVQAMRAILGVTVAELAKATGIPLPRLEAVEAGGTTTRAERHDITDALSWLSNHRVAQGSDRVANGQSPRQATGSLSQH